MLDKYFKMFSLLLLLFMIVCYLNSNTNSYSLTGGNLQTNLSNAEDLLKKAEEVTVNSTSI